MASGSNERRERLLDAAQYLFLRNGFRGTSMEAIAREARVAKPTLYGNFQDKDEVLAATTSRLMTRLAEAFERGLGGPGSPAERIARALGDKHGLVLELLAGSPHAEELYSEHSRLSGAAIAEFEASLVARIAGQLADMGMMPAEQMARIIVAGADGIARHAGDAAALRADIGFLVRRLLA
ncbi:MAG TPA: helix-turn-helix domain-containing protein [Devosiaceae bacterium]